MAAWRLPCAQTYHSSEPLGSILTRLVLQEWGSRATEAGARAARGGLAGARREPGVALFALHAAQLALAAAVLLPVRAWGARPWLLFQAVAVLAHGAKARPGGALPAGRPRMHGQGEACGPGRS